MATRLPQNQGLEAHQCADLQRLLAETTLPVTAIAAECGLPDSAYFARLFHKFTGTSPSAWRKRSHH